MRPVAAATDQLPDLRAMTLDDAEAFSVAQGWPRFRGEQVWRWVHDKGARTFEEMTNLSADTREQFAARATIGSLTVAEVQTSRDGTRKLRLVTRDGSSIESVLIPMGEHVTQCISSQVGCAVDCQFCATAKLGLKRNLDAGEIVDQVYLGRRLLDSVHAEITLRGRADDARAAETGRMTCRGRLDAGDAEIERQFVN